MSESNDNIEDNLTNKNIIYTIDRKWIDVSERTIETNTDTVRQPFPHHILGRINRLCSRACCRTYCRDCYRVYCRTKK